jgi:hypothetical protein
MDSTIYELIMQFSSIIMFFTFSEVQILSLAPCSLATSIYVINVIFG